MSCWLWCGKSAFQALLSRSKGEGYGYLEFMHSVGSLNAFAAVAEELCVVSSSVEDRFVGLGG